MLPGYRERIVQVYLENHEGGLNLNMPKCVIDKLIEKGTSAGQVFTHQPDERDLKLKLPHFDLAHHQWVRFRVLMAQLEREVATLSDDLSKLSLNAADDATYERLIEIYGSLIDQQLKKLATKHEWYKSMNADECQQAINRIKDLWSFIKPWKQEPEDLFRKDAPTPNPVLRLTPEL